jgi:hypothetical protein
VNARKLLDIVTSRGLSLQHKNGELIILGPMVERTPALMGQLKQHKEILLEFLGHKPKKTCRWVSQVRTHKDRTIEHCIPEQELIDAYGWLYWDEQEWYLPQIPIEKTDLETTPREWELAQW